MKPQHTATAAPVHFHGECLMFPGATIPDGCTEEALSTDRPYEIVAESEQVGNHHVIDHTPGLKFFRHAPTNKRFVRVVTPTRMRCVHPQRHDEIPMPAGDYELGIADGYDPFAQKPTKVAD